MPSISDASGAIEANGRRYAMPVRPTCVICLDGCDPRYLDDALARGLVPRIGELIESGALAIGRSQVPSFTNPNNLSIVTGVPPSGHGIPGNHYLDERGVERQLTDPALLRAETILAAYHAAGVPVLAVTTKEKLRDLLSAGGVPCVSVERARQAALPGTGIVADLLDRAVPQIYDWDASDYALELGRVLAERLEAVVVYISLTDAVQHAHEPGSRVSDRFLQALDGQVGRYLDDGYELALVADHGMNAKPEIRFVADELAAAGVRSGRTVLPITDAYVRHHAALGSACFIYADESELQRAADALGALDGIAEVIFRDEAAAQLRLPADRIGDLVVLGDARTALGGHEHEHDLSALAGPLRSHGGRAESAVPIMLSRTPGVEGARLLARGAGNEDVFHLALGYE